MLFPRPRAGIPCALSPAAGLLALLFASAVDRWVERSDAWVEGQRSMTMAERLRLRGVKAEALTYGWGAAGSGRHLTSNSRSGSRIPTTGGAGVWLFEALPLGHDPAEDPDRVVFF